MAASMAPMMNVAEMTTSGLMPMRAATRGFSAVARMARPRLVRLTSHMRNASVMTVVARMVICVTEITAPPNSIGSRERVEGYDFGFGAQMIMAKVCNSSDMPMAVIRGASRGELRSGR
ncbi:hypothetical protein D9M68_843000 [compost metagenome]